MKLKIIPDSIRFNLRAYHFRDTQKSNRMKTLIFSLMYAVLFFQLAFFCSGYIGTYFDIEIAVISIVINVAYSIAIALFGIITLFRQNVRRNSTFFAPIVGAIVMAFFAPGISACFLSIIAVLAMLSDGNVNKLMAIENHLVNSKGSD